MKTKLLWIALFFPSFAAAADNFGAFAKAFCVRCHGPDVQKGDFRIDQLSTIDPAGFETIYEQLASEQMPPEGQRQPTAAVRKSMMAQVLELAKQDTQITSPGLRRLNKREYSNTVRDLLGLHNGIFDPGEYIYDDEVDEGFDTFAESLVISNELLLEYMDAAEKSLRHALFTPSVTKPNAAKVDVDIKKMKGAGGGRYVHNYKDHIVLRSGGKGMLYADPSSRAVKLPGRYSITVTASAVDRDHHPIPFSPETGPLIMGFGVKFEGSESVSSKPKVLKTFELSDNKDQTFQFDLWIDRDHFPYFSFANGPGKPVTQIRAGIRQGKLDASMSAKGYHGPGVKLSQFTIEGPFYDEWPPQSFKATYGSDKIPDLKKPTERLYALGRFAKRAFRRSVTREEMEPWLDYMQSQYSASRDWHDAFAKTLAAMMSSVDFLYLREGHGELESSAVANRLSYFLWSTMPDAELMTLALSGKLKDPTVLKEQVNRLLKDERSIRFCNSFSNQWLSLDKLGTMPPDQKGEFREYYRDRLEPAMLEETHLYFRNALQENLSVRDFIDSDYSFINGALARLYGVPFEGGNEFARVSFASDSKRGGLLGHASILTLSANGVDTSPVERGVWVLADLLGTPPPPPPKEVPALTPDLNGAQTVRDLLEKHRSDASCMECHRRMDPLGFALEAYDPIGRFRTKYTKRQR